MAEYIEREKIWPALNAACVPYNRATAKAIESIPTADVRPVVFCKDCKNSYEWANVDGDNYRYCGYLRSRWNHDTDRMVCDDDYRKWGRKREES